MLKIQISNVRVENIRKKRNSDFFSRKQVLRTDTPVEFHANDRVFMPLVLPGAVAELRDVALGHGVGRARVHQPVGHQDTDYGIRVAFECLQQTMTRGVFNIAKCDFTIFFSSS